MTIITAQRGWELFQWENGMDSLSHSAGPIRPWQIALEPEPPFSNYGTHCYSFGSKLVSVPLVRGTS